VSVPSSELAPPSPLPQGSVSHPLEPKGGGGGQHSLAGEGVGGAYSNDWRESLALCLLYVSHVPLNIGHIPCTDLLSRGGSSLFERLERKPDTLSTLCFPCTTEHRPNTMYGFTVTVCVRHNRKTYFCDYRRCRFSKAYFEPEDGTKIELTGLF
jgi:hypothetical protein